MKVAIPKARSTITDDTGGLEISIPAKHNIFLVAFLGLWLVGWAFVSGKLAMAMIKGQSPAPEHLFFVVWLAVWTAGGGFAIYTWLWMLRGRERVRLHPDSLSVRREVLGLGRTREYDLPHITNLRVAPASFNPFDPSAGLQFWGIGGGLIAFDYGSKTFRFGSSIDEAEAKTIVERLRSRHHFGDAPPEP